MMLNFLLQLKKLQIFTVFLALASLVVLQFLKSFSCVELEHIHSSYFVSHGLLPYKDFFQHHHHFMWYVYAPLFLLFGVSTLALISIKTLSIIIGFLNLVLIFKISAYYFENKSWRFFPVLIAACSYPFLSTGMEIRPDNLMLLFLLLSFY